MPEHPDNPGSAEDAWRMLYELAEPYSPQWRQVDEARGRCEVEGITSSGVAIQRAMAIAYDWGYRYNWRQDRLVRDRRRSKGLIAVAAVGIVVAGGAFAASLEGNEVGQGVTNAVTALAAFASLVVVLRDR